MATIREMDVEKLKDQVIDEVIALQRDIHQHPEIGVDTVRTVYTAVACTGTSGSSLRVAPARSARIRNFNQSCASCACSRASQKHTAV